MDKSSCSYVWRHQKQVYWADIQNKRGHNKFLGKQISWVLFIIKRRLLFWTRLRKLSQVSHPDQASQVGSISAVRSWKYLSQVAIMNSIPTWDIPSRNTVVSPMLGNWILPFRPAVSQFSGDIFYWCLCHLLKQPVLCFS